MSPNTSESLETNGKFSFLSRIKIDKYSKTPSWFVPDGPLPSIRKNTQNGLPNDILKISMEMVYTYLVMIC